MLLVPLSLARALGYFGATATVVSLLAAMGADRLFGGRCYAKRDVLAVIAVAAAD